MISYVIYIYIIHIYTYNHIYIYIIHIPPLFGATLFLKPPCRTVEYRDQKIQQLEALRISSTDPPADAISSQLGPLCREHGVQDQAPFLGTQAPTDLVELGDFRMLGIILLRVCKFYLKKVTPKMVHL